MPRAALQRHSDAPCAVLRAVDASVERSAGALELAWQLSGDIARLRIPAPRPPRFADRLWQHTCCEVFVARAGEPGYREFNFAPSGEWAQYAFERYRERAPAAGTPDAPRVGLFVTCLVDLMRPRIGMAAAPAGRLRVALAAVVESADGSLSYWALRHPPGKPDFHHADGFALELDEARA